MSGLHVVSACAAPTRSILREHIGLLLAAHAGFVAAYSALSLGWCVEFAVILAGSAWVVFRAFHTPANPSLPLLGTSALLCAVAWVTGRSVMHELSPLFSGQALLFLLSIVSWFDVVDLGRELRRVFAVPGFMRQWVLRIGLRVLCYGVGAAILLNAIAVPFLQEWSAQATGLAADPHLAMHRMTLSQNISFRLFQGLSALFFFTIGACVGSFLNVVVYRVPLGISVMVKPSQCPGCDRKIKGHDNLPLIGWLKLGGCCRNCGVSISSRYPTVELLIGLVFLVWYFLELISGGLNLPGRPPNMYSGVLWILFYTKWDLVMLYAFHCSVFSTLFAWAMIRRDRHPVPVHIATSAILVVGAVHLLVASAGGSGEAGDALMKLNLYAPGLYTLPGIPRDVLHSSSLVGAGITGLLGAVAGLMVAAGAGLLKNVKWNIGFPGHCPSWVLLGVGLGWQAVVGVAALLLLLQFVGVLSQHLYVRSADSMKTAPVRWLLLPLAMFLQHCFGRQLFDWFAGGS